LISRNLIDGLTEDLITDLSKVPELFVIARNSSFAYKGQIGKYPPDRPRTGCQIFAGGSRATGGRPRTDQCSAHRCSRRRAGPIASTGTRYLRSARRSPWQDRGGACRQIDAPSGQHRRRPGPDIATRVEIRYSEGRAATKIMRSHHHLGDEFLKNHDAGRTAGFSFAWRQSIVRRGMLADQWFRVTAETAAHE
jgi:hypothetical protein